MGKWTEGGMNGWLKGSRNRQMKEWINGWMDRWVDGWMVNCLKTSIKPDFVNNSLQIFVPTTDFKFHETQGLILSVFAFSGPHTALDWWQVQQQVKNTCLLKINDSSLMLLFLSLSNIILRREFLDREKNGNLEIEMLCWYFFSFKLYKETACGKFW